MDNLDDSENNAKVSDSAYSNSCSNSQSRRSQSSKSTHSGSHSSRSSGYGGKPSVYSVQSGEPIEKRSKDKEVKQKKQLRFDKPSEVVLEEGELKKEQTAIIETITEETDDVEHMPAPQAETGLEIVEKACVERSGSIDEENSCNKSPFNSAFSGRALSPNGDGFSCVISMHDGVVMYTTASITTTLGFPKDMWIGRSFIDFVHSRDRNTFASHITSGLAVPKNVNGTIKEAPAVLSSVCTMVCRLRRYRSLSNGFGIKDHSVTFMPFLLKLSFKNISDEEGKVTYLVIQATPFFSAFKTPNEIVEKPIPFVMRHAANGNVEYIDPESVPYLGYLPQDLEGKDALMLYHADDLSYLRQIYETIVKEGGVPRCKPYRMITQNWDYIKVETEWSSFINPWSKKLEFVIGKHHIIEGPTNPNVFESPEINKNKKRTEEEKNKAQCVRDNIIRIMNEVLTKPAEVAKQQMTKRCQDVASFMESLIEEHPKPEEPLHVEVQEPDNSYYERDSVMLGGISPHHDHNDSKSSIETTLSYNQLNYNETLQRYFDSHQQHYSYEDYNTVNGENILSLKDVKSPKVKLSSMAQTSLVSGDMSSSDSAGDSYGAGSSGVFIVDTPALRLTETLISKHNTEMEKELMKIHRETRSSTKGERKKVVKENRQKKKEHLARCNATFQPTSVINSDGKVQPHGLKRTSKPVEVDVSTHKHHCPTPRHSRRKQQPTSAAAAQPSTTVTTTVAPAQWPHNAANNMNTFFVGVGFPQQMPIMNTMGGMAGMIPMYYAPAASAIPATSEMNAGNMNPHYPQPMQCMMYGQAMYGSPFMYSPISSQMAYPPHAVNASPMGYPLGLANSNYEEACKPSIAKTKTPGRDKWQKSPLLATREGLGASGLWREKKLRRQSSPSKTDQESSGSNFSSSITLNREGRNSDQSEAGTMAMNLCFSGTGSSPESSGPIMSSQARRNSLVMRSGKKSSDDTQDRTDGESSYSSFYSSFFKTESGSADDSGDAKKTNARNMRESPYRYESPQEKRVTRRKRDPPWTEQVCVTSELIYKYQIMTKNLEDVLKADKMKLTALEQPPLVSDQLSQLYLDLQLEGVASKLTLEEGITSSSSSGEEATSEPCKMRRKRKYSKLAIFYEEDAPLPFPETQPEAKAPASPTASPLHAPAPPAVPRAYRHHASTSASLPASPLHAPTRAPAIAPLPAVVPAPKASSATSAPAAPAPAPPSPSPVLPSTSAI